MATLIIITNNVTHAGHQIIYVFLLFSTTTEIYDTQELAISAFGCTDLLVQFFSLVFIWLEFAVLLTLLLWTQFLRRRQFQEGPVAEMPGPLLEVLFRSYFP